MLSILSATVAPLSQCFEVESGFRDNITEKAEDDLTRRLRVDLDVEVHFIRHSAQGFSTVARPSCLCNEQSSTNVVPGLHHAFDL